MTEIDTDREIKTLARRARSYFRASGDPAGRVRLSDSAAEWVWQLVRFAVVHSTDRARLLMVYRVLGSIADCEWETCYASLPRPQEDGLALTNWLASSEHRMGYLDRVASKPHLRVLLASGGEVDGLRMLRLAQYHEIDEVMGLVHGFLEDMAAERVREDQPLVAE